MDRKIINKKAINNRSSFCRMISKGLKAEGITIARTTVNKRLVESGLKVYRHRKKPRLIDKMKQAGKAWVRAHVDWASEQWEQIRVEHTYEKH